jgi:hypothetical protein
MGMEDDVNGGSVFLFEKIDLHNMSHPTFLAYRYLGLSYLQHSEMEARANTNFEVTTETGACTDDFTLFNTVP